MLVDLEPAIEPVFQPVGYALTGAAVIQDLAQMVELDIYVCFSLRDQRSSMGQVARTIFVSPSQSSIIRQLVHHRQQPGLACFRR